MQKHFFTVEAYQKMSEVGILSPELRTELIAGEIIEMAPMGTKHNYVLRELYYLLIEQLPKSNAIVQSQAPVVLGDNYEPEPDITILKPYNYKYRLPQAEDIFICIEISDSTLHYDRQSKLPIYAAFNIPEVWLLNLVDNQAELYSQPQAGQYQKKDIQINKLQSIILPSLTLDIHALLSN